VSEGWHISGKAWPPAGLPISVVSRRTKTDSSATSASDPTMLHLIISTFVEAGAA
jgi:hypothetical protein